MLHAAEPCGEGRWSHQSGNEGVDEEVEGWSKKVERERKTWRISMRSV